MRCIREEEGERKGRIEHKEGTKGDQREENMRYRENLQRTNYTRLGKRRKKRRGKGKGEKKLSRYGRGKQRKERKGRE